MLRATRAAPAGRPVQPAPVIRALLVARAGREPRTAAVVANAPLPPSSARAARIDAADLVVRMTTFAVDDALPAVGRRTDAVVLQRAVEPGPGTFADRRSRVYLLAEPGRSYWEAEPLPPWWPADLGVVPIPNRTVTDPLKRRMRIADGTASWPTTGTLAVGLLRTVFPAMRILLTGSSLADPAGAGRTSFAHRTGADVLLTPEHRLAAEARVLRAWVREGALEVLP